MTTDPVTAARLGDTLVPGNLMAGATPAGHEVDSRTGGPRTWTVLLPPGLPLLNLNDRLHWAKAYRLREELRNAALAMLRAARVPQLNRVSVLVVYDPPPDWRDRDPDNIAASVKPLVDALRPPKTVKVGARWVRVTSRAGYVLADDDSAHVAWVTCMIGQPFPAGRIRMTITDQTDLEDTTAEPLTGIEPGGAA